MKKSKIIAPAAAILVFSSAAAVTGTVAWFTANRLATVDMSSITAINPESGLLYELVAGAGSQTITGEVAQQNQAIEFKEKFRDGSVDVDAGKVSKALLDSDGNPSSYVEVASPYSDTVYKEKNIYRAQTFTVKLYVEANSSTEKFHVFFNAQTSNVERSTTADADGKTDQKIANAYRVGFKTANNWFVFAPLATQAITSMQYVKATQSGDTYTYGTASYAATECFKNSGFSETYQQLSGSTAVDMSTATASAKDNYLGTIDGSAISTSGDTGKVVVTVYTWFEGCDPDCTTDTATGLDVAFTSTLKFGSLKSTD